jgi:hypothetical protein
MPANYAGSAMSGASAGMALGPWGAVAGAGVGLLSAYLGDQATKEYTEADFDYDPERLAKKRYQELTDDNSNFNKGLLGKYMRIAGNSTPGKDTLMAPIRAAGGGYMGSAAIAAQQAKGLSEKGRNDAFEGWTSAVIGNEGNASRYLGLEYDRGKYVNQGVMGSKLNKDSNRADMYAEGSKFGFGMAGKAMGENWSGSTNDWEEPEIDTRETFLGMFNT